MKTSRFIILLICIWVTTVASRPVAEMIKIPGGIFIMGPSSAGEQDTNQSIDLPTFYIDRFETSNAEYSRIVPNHPYPKGAERHPVTSVTWQEAQSYCEKTGKRLPTSAEWEKSARGVDARAYPWGNKVLSEKAHPYFSGLIKRNVGLNKKDRSPYGVRDMAGSVWEWTADVTKGKAVTRGGLWNFHLDYEYSKTYEYSFAPINKKLPFIGFRCAK